MGLLKKKFLLVGALVIGGLIFTACPPNPEPPAPVEKNVTLKFSEKNNSTLGEGSPIKITISPYDKEVEVYYEIVDKNATSTLTEENYKNFTKYTTPFTAPNGSVYAVAVKNSNVVSKITTAKYKIINVVDYSVIKGVDGNIPKWTKSNDGVQNIPDLDFTGKSNITDELKAALTEKKADPNFFKKPKNFIMMMGDGMGVSQIVAATKHRGPLLMNELPYKAVSNSYTRENATNDSRGIVTDSAAGGTKLATGYRTTKLFAGIDAEGNELLNLSELARLRGKKVGFVTNAELPDATPAAFTVHTKNRSQGWNKICEQEVLFGADLFMGGTDSSLNGALSTVAPLSGAKIKKAYTLAEILTNFETTDLLWGLFPEGDTKLGRWNETVKDVPSMHQQMALSLARLQATSDDNGFFLMFENTYTDIYGHWNTSFASVTKEDKNHAVDSTSRNISGIINEVKDFDECLAIALKFVLENPDTVLIVNADHETGDMKFKTGWENDFYKLSATSGSHSNQNLPIFAIGYGMDVIDTKNGDLFTVEDCTKVETVDNTICGQVFGNLINDQDNSFGGDINTETRGRTRDTFTVTANAASDKFEFKINESKLPMSSGDLIQFKIKPYDENAVITIAEAGVNGLKFADKKNEKVAIDSKGNVTSVLTPAYSQAFVEDSDKLDGWYQFSIKPSSAIKALTVSITGGTIAAGTQVLIDDFTVQYGSTKGYVEITGDNVIATKN